MSARALPVAARLSRRQLRLLSDVQDGHPSILCREKMAERLTPAFLLVHRGPVGEGDVAELTDAGRAVLAERRQAGLR